MNRIELLQYLIDNNKYENYLEIGCYKDECFKYIKCNKKTGVDPYSGGTKRMTSDKFFLYKNLNIFCRKKYDLIFIDGLHFSEQVFKDISNSLKWLNPNGTIVMHDCNPPTEDSASWPMKNDLKEWNGDVWKAFVHFRQNENLDMITADFDWGCGMIKIKPNSDLIKLNNNYTKLTWQDLDLNRQKWLRLKSFEEIKCWLN